MMGYGFYPDVPYNATTHGGVLIWEFAKSPGD
jgi:hypothetical protein